MKVLVKNLTFRFLMNDIDCLVPVEVSYEEGERASTIKFIKNFTEQLHAAGASSGKQGKYQRTYSEKMTGANGTHPDELEPYLAEDGKQVACTLCGDPLGIKRGTVKKPGVRFGQPYALIKHTTNRKCEQDYGFLD